MSLALGVATVKTTTGEAAAWGDEQPGTLSHLPESNVRIPHIEGSAEPTVNTVRSVGYAGRRGFNALLVRVGIPGLPGGPPKIARMGQGYIGTAGRKPGQITTVAQYAPIVTADQSPDWTKFLS